MNRVIFQKLAEAARGHRSAALGIIAEARGSSPQKVGAKAVFYLDRRIEGTLGGGCLEAEVHRLALHALKTNQPATFDLVLDHDFGWDDGLICGGKVLGLILPNVQTLGESFWNQLAEPSGELTWGVRKDFSCALAGSEPEPSKVLSPSDWLYTETLTPRCALWIAGSGHVAQAVAPLALQLDFAVTIFDDRPELANHQMFPGEVKVELGDWGKLCSAPWPNARAFGLIVTRGHQHDALVLESWIHRPFQFLGMIGSTRKARTLSEHFIKHKLATPEQMARVACPVGIRIRSRTVMEIAVDVMAQYIDKRAECRTEHRMGSSRNMEFV